MVSYSQSIRPTWFIANNPLAGINWSEVGNAYRVFADNPSAGILHILAAGQDSNWQQWVMKRLTRQSGNLTDVKVNIDIPTLLELPEHTLGGAYARHIVSQGFDPEAFASRNESAFNYRLAISHDIHHVITGFDGSPVGEFGLAAFTLVQFRNLLNVFVLSNLPWFIIGNFSVTFKVITSAIKGFWLGFVAKPIIAYPFELNWHKPLTEVRQELGI